MQLLLRHFNIYCSTMRAHGYPQNERHRNWDPSPPRSGWRPRWRPAHGGGALTEELSWGRRCTAVSMHETHVRRCVLHSRSWPQQAAWTSTAQSTPWTASLQRCAPVATMLLTLTIQRFQVQHLPSRSFDDLVFLGPDCEEGAFRVCMRWFTFMV